MIMKNAGQGRLKKLIILVAGLVTACVSISGCSGVNNAGGNADGSVIEGGVLTEGQEAASGTDRSYHIGVVNISDHPSLITIRDAFSARIQEVLTDNPVELDLKSAQGDMSNVNSICQKFVGDGKDMIVAIATPAAQAAAAATKEIPIVYSAVSAPEAAGLTGLPNVTGTSDAIPVQSIFDLAFRLTPGVKSFGLVYNMSEANSMAVIQDAKTYMDEKGIKYREATVTNTSEVQQSAASLVGKVDAIFSPIDNTVAEAMPVLAGVASMNRIPLYVGADSMVADGGLATVGIDYSVLGVRTAEMAAEILGGKSPADIPYEVMNNYSTYLNTGTAQEIELEIPEEILEEATILGSAQ